MHIVLHSEKGKWRGKGNPHLPAPKCTHSSFIGKIHTFILHFSARRMYLYLYFLSTGINELTSHSSEELYLEEKLLII